MKLFGKEITVSNKKEAAVATGATVLGGIVTAVGAVNLVDGAKKLKNTISITQLIQQQDEDTEDEFDEEFEDEELEVDEDDVEEE